MFTGSKSSYEINPKIKNKFKKAEEKSNFKSRNIVRIKESALLYVANPGVCTTHNRRRSNIKSSPNDKPTDFRFIIYRFSYCYVHLPV